MVIFGEWKNDKLNGLGWVSISKNYALMLYKGEWENNMKKGVGVEYNPAKK